MIEAESPPAVQNPPRRWYQCRLWLLLIFVTLCAIPCSWLAVKMRPDAASLIFEARMETFGMYLYPPGTKNFDCVSEVRARAGDAIGISYNGRGGAPFTVVEIIDRHHPKVRVCPDLKYVLRSENDDSRRSDFMWDGIYNVVLGSGEVLEAQTRTVCGGTQYILRIKSVD